MDILSQNAEPAGVTTAGKNTEEGARTLDLWIHNPVLYQLSYLGIGWTPKPHILRHPNPEAKTEGPATSEIFLAKDVSLGLATLVRLVGPGGVRSVVAESALVKHQLVILNHRNNLLKEQSAITSNVIEAENS